MSKELTTLQNNIETLVGELSKEKLLIIIMQSYLDHNLELIESIKVNNYTLTILNEKLKQFTWHII